jgi:hypothetical protein
MTVRNLIDRTCRHNAVDICPIRPDVSLRNKMKSHRIPSPTAKNERNEKIVARAKAGQSVADLAREYGLSRIRIKQIIESPPRSISDVGIVRKVWTINPSTELESLPISARLSRACGLLNIRTVTDLSGSSSELYLLTNVGKRTLLEVSEILHEAGLADTDPLPSDQPGPQDRGMNPGKRSILRKNVLSARN